MCRTPVRVCDAPPSFAKRELGRSPTVRSVPGPAKWNASRSSASSLHATCQISSIRSDQAAAGSGSSSRQTWTMSPQSRSSASDACRSGIDRLRPAARREGRQRPRDGALVDHLEDLRDGRQPVEPRPGRVDAVQQPRRDDRHEHGAGRIEVAEVEHPPSQPRRHPLERAVGRRPPPGSASRRDRSRGRRRSGPRARTRRARSPPPAAAPRAAPRRRAPGRAGRSRRRRRSGRRSASGRRRPRADRIA